MKQHQWQPCSAVRFGQVQSSQSMPPASNNHLPQLQCASCNAPIVVSSLWLWSSLSACGCCCIACLPACPCSSSGLAGIAHDTHLGNVQLATSAACNAVVVVVVVLPMREMARALCLFGYFMPFAMACLCFSPFLPLPLLVCLSDNKDDKISRKNHKLCVYVWKNNIAQM